MYMSDKIDCNTQWVRLQGISYLNNYEGTAPTLGTCSYVANMK